MISIVRLQNMVKGAIKGLIDILLIIIRIMFGIIVLMGSFAALILLYKMYPDTGMILIEPLIDIFIFVIKIIKIIAFFIIILSIIYLITLFKQIFNESDKKREIKREEFLNKLACKLKRKMNKRT